jgi:hypothetical protein
MEHHTAQITLQKMDSKSKLNVVMGVIPGNCHTPSVSREQTGRAGKVAYESVKHAQSKVVGIRQQGVRPEIVMPVFLEHTSNPRNFTCRYFI